MSQCPFLECIPERAPTTAREGIGQLWLWVGWGLPDDTLLYVFGRVDLTVTSLGMGDLVHVWFASRDCSPVPPTVQVGFGTAGGEI
jgi:hypothetical protein